MIMKTASLWSREDAIAASLKSSSSTLSQHGLRDQDVAHRQHAQPSQLLGRVEDDRREARRHLRVQTNFNARLDLVLALDLRGASSRRGSIRSRGHVDGAAVRMRRVDGVDANLKFRR